MSGAALREEDRRIREIIPWARSNPLRDIMEEREKEKKEVLRIAERFSSPLFSGGEHSGEKANKG